MFYVLVERFGIDQVLKPYIYSISKVIGIQGMLTMNPNIFRAFAINFTHVGHFPCIIIYNLLRSRKIQHIVHQFFLPVPPQCLYILSMFL